MASNEERKEYAEREDIYCIIVQCGSERIMIVRQQW